MSIHPGSDFTTTKRRSVYPAISPSRPELSQSGRTVVITGSSTGIGLAIAKGFSAAGAGRVFILGRREALVGEAVSQLQAEFPRTGFVGRRLDVTDAAAVEEFWSSLERAGIAVDVLVLNAAKVGPGKPILDIDRSEIWSSYITNVQANLNFTDFFYHQKSHDPQKKLFLLNVSTSAIHDFEIAGGFPNYSTTKNAGTLLLQEIAKDVPASKMQIVSFHPGAIYTDMAREAGYSADFPWDDENLPGSFAVWAASDEAEFLHGRFVWAAWDVDELRAGDIRKNIDNTLNYLKIGVVGI